MAENQTSFVVPKPLFQDQDLLVIDKLAGLLSVPDGYEPDLPHLRGILEPTYGELWMVHRLDKETSGVMVLARNAEAHQKLNHVFKDRQVDKLYHCLVYPTPSWREMDIQLPLKVNADRKHRTRVDSTGKTARSICTVQKSYSLGALIEIRILSGITHQIRAHLREFQLGILGDTLYGAGLPEQPFQVPRMMLHARSLTFPHPTTGEKFYFTANYPDDFRQAYTMLKLSKEPDAAF
jgi:RluA family pseudouridine synthase